MTTLPQIIIILLSYVPYLGLNKNVLLDVYNILEHPTWILLDGRDDVRICTVTVFYHIHYINSDARNHFLLYGYGLKVYHILSPDYIRVQIFPLCLFSLCLYDVFNSFFYPILTTYPTFSLVKGGPICRASMCFHPVITSQDFENRATCRYFVKTLQACDLLCSV